MAIFTTDFTGVDLSRCELVKDTDLKKYNECRFRGSEKKQAQHRTYMLIGGAAAGLVLLFVLLRRR